LEKRGYAVITASGGSEALAAIEVAQQGILDPDINFMQKPFSSMELPKKTREILDGQ